MVIGRDMICECSAHGYERIGRRSSALEQRRERADRRVTTHFASELSGCEANDDK